MLEDYLPPKALGLVVEWANIHKDELIKNWELSKEHKKLEKIKPLI